MSNQRLDDTMRAARRAATDRLIEMRGDVEQRLGVDTGSGAVLDDPTYAAALAAWGVFNDAAEALLEDLA